MPRDPAELTIEPEDALRLRATYPEATATPEVIETHISRVYMTDQYVYKLKKPVKFDFLNYSTLQHRHRACQEELDINRRLAPDIYLEVVSIGRQENGDWKIGADKAEDWLVKMRRLSEDRCFENLVRSQQYTDTDIEQIIVMLGEFYRSLPPQSCSSYRNDIAQHVTENRDELLLPEHELSGIVVERVHAAQHQFIFVHGDQFEQRVANRHLIEGHGDLRAEHLYLTDPPVCIDALEFSKPLRTVDTADELCFLLVTCEILGDDEVGKRILQGVCARLEDESPRDLLDFYCAYRACVRAKVAALRTNQTFGNVESSAKRRSNQYLDLADKYARRLGLPRIVIVRGLSGTGKTTLAEKLSKQLGARHLSTDRLRQLDSNAPLVGEVRSKYSDQARCQVYDKMLSKACELVDEGLSAILDGTFLQADVLRTYISQLRDAGADLHVVTCVCPHDVAMARIKSRADDPTCLSDADAGVYEQQLETVEDVAISVPSIEIDTTEEMRQMLDRLSVHLRWTASASSG